MEAGKLMMIFYSLETLELARNFEILLQNTVGILLII